MLMEENIYPSIPPQPSQIPGQLAPEALEEMKQKARDMAITQYMAQKQQQQNNQNPGPEQKIVYVRRNLTVAELLLLVVLLTGVITGIQASWNFVTERLPKIEIRMK